MESLNQPTKPDVRTNCLLAAPGESAIRDIPRDAPLEAAQVKELVQAFHDRIIALQQRFTRAKTEEMRLRIKLSQRLNPELPPVKGQSHAE